MAKKTTPPSPTPPPRPPEPAAAPQPEPPAVLDARWLEPDRARRGDWKPAEQAEEGAPIRLEARVSPRVPEGSPVRFGVYRAGPDGADALVATLDGTVGGGAAAADWTCVWTGPEGDAYVEPRLYFQASAAGVSARSPAIPVTSWVEIDVRTPSGAPHPCAYLARRPDGREVRGTTDESGLARILTPPGEVAVTLSASAGGKPLEAWPG